MNTNPNSVETFRASESSWVESREKSISELSRFKVSSRRINSTLNFIPGIDDLTGLQGYQPFPYLDTYSTVEQEKILTQEILYILSGVEGNLISTLNPISLTRPVNKIEFMIDSRVEPSLKDLALQIAQLAGYYYTVTRYVENWSRFEHGQVNQALSASIRSILKDYLILVTQMETMFKKEELTLQKLWFFIHPTLQTMTILSSVVISIEEINGTGGSVLTILHEKALAMIGDSMGQKLCYGLADEASKPYFAILESWIYKGVIRDPFCEFFVYENDNQLNGVADSIDDYWDNRYKASIKKCPSFLKKVADEILKAGKYLNVIRQCGKDVMLYMGGKIRYSIHERVYVTAVEDAYSFASKSLLDLLLKDYDLMKRLESVKHHLLMDQGDFIVQFLDLTESELNKEVDDLNETRLTSLLELALRTSSSGNDPYKDCVRVELFPFGIREQMHKIMSVGGTSTGESHLFDNGIADYSIAGVKAFAFSYAVQWPISLVLSQRALTCYQLIFRHLFYCKHVERQLCRVWIGGKGFKNVCLMKDHEKASSFSLRQKMLNFVQNLQYYISFEVIEPAWHNFLGMMSKVQNVDQVLASHMSFINAVLDESMLINPLILDKMCSTLSLCLEFCKKFLNSSLNVSSIHPTLKSTVETLDAAFTTGLVEFLRGVSIIVQNPNKSTKVVNIIHRMNFNGFYTTALEESPENNTESSLNPEFQFH